MDDISLYALAIERSYAFLNNSSTGGWGSLRAGASKEWWKTAFVPTHMAKLIEFHKKVPWISTEHGPKFYLEVSEGKYHPMRYQISYRGPEYARKWVFRPRVHHVACDWSEKVWDQFHGMDFSGMPNPIEAPRYGMNADAFGFVLDMLLIGDDR